MNDSGLVFLVAAIAGCGLVVNGGWHYSYHDRHRLGAVLVVLGFALYLAGAINLIWSAPPG